MNLERKIEPEQSLFTRRLSKKEMQLMMEFKRTALVVLAIKTFPGVELRMFVERLGN